MKKSIRLFAFTLLVVFLVGYVLLCVAYNLGNPVVASAMVIIGLVMFYQFSNAVWDQVGEMGGGAFLSVIVSCTFGALVTYGLHHYLELGPVGSAAFVGTLVGVVPFGKTTALRDVQAATYAGAFVGMSSAAVLSGFVPVLVAGVSCGLLFCASRGLLMGYGGRLGAIAFASVNVVSTFIILTSL